MPKNNLNCFFVFVGDNYLITYDAILNYYFLIKESDYWSLQRIDKKKIRYVKEFI